MTASPKFAQAEIDEQAVRAGRGVRWLIAVRFALAAGSLGLLLVLSIGDQPQYERNLPGIVLLGFTLLLNSGYLVALRFVKAGRGSFIVVQVCADGILETALIFLTGGAGSIFLVLYFATVLSATILISPRGGVFVASLATTMLAAVTILYFFNSRGEIILPLVHKEYIAAYQGNFNFILAFMIAEAAGLHMVALLGGLLAKRLTQFRALYEEILSYMGDGLLAMDEGKRIIFINEEARKILHYRSYEPLVGKVISDVFRRRMEKDVFAILNWREEVDIELDVEPRDGGVKTINIKTSVLYDKKGRARGTIAIFADLTAKKRMERLEQKASKYDEMGELAAGIAHEIRNPLASIRGAVQELGSLDMAGADNKKLAQIVIRESDRLDGIIKDFLELARMKPPSAADVNLDALLDEIRLLLKSRPDARDVEIEIRSGGRFVLRADPAQMKQVFLNLGINAIEAMGGRGKITITTAPAELPSRIPLESGGTLPKLQSAAAVIVSDTGPGILPENIGKIFTPFFTTRTKGTGMGLAIVDKIVSTHHGSVDVASTPGKGASFRVVLPLARKGVER